MVLTRSRVALLASLTLPALLSAQNPATGAPLATSALARPIAEADWPAHVRRTAVTDATLLRIVEEGMQRSQASSMAQVMMDSIGPRLTGSPGFQRAGDWLLRKYGEWGIPARKEAYGTWNSFARGTTHIDLITPRMRTLEGHMLAWSPATNGPVEGDVVVLPAMESPDAFDAFAATTRGKFVMISAPQLSCRAPSQLAEFGTPATLESLRARQDSLRASFNDRNVKAAGLQDKLKAAGAAGVVTFGWSNYPGINKVFGSTRQQVPTFELSCEDYGLVYRLATNNQGPKLRVNIAAQFLGEQPVHNVVAEWKGQRRTANQYVMVSAHMDSWEAASGATDNATGTIVMLEAMRILKAIGYTPRRTIMAGHWAGEEQGLNGSRSFAKDHPDVVGGLHALFNQDNGTGRVVGMNASGLVSADTVLRGYLGQLPNEFTRWIRYGGVGAPGTGGTDHVAFVCSGAPGFNLNALSWDYGFTTWHTNRDTYDKVVTDDLKQNATLVAMLVYVADQDANLMPRIKLDPLPAGPNGQPAAWPTCADGLRNSSLYRR
jgi:carboxypeptidase Q